MSVCESFGNLLLSQWLWNVTWGWYHIPINILFMCFFLKLFVRVSIIPAVFISIFANLYAVALYSAFTVGVLMYACNLNLDPNIPFPVADPFHASFYLGAIYIVLQFTFFLLLNVFYKLSMFKALLVIIASNMLTAWAVYWLLPAM